MKDFIKYILILFVGVILGYFITIYNIKIIATEKTKQGELITYKILYNDYNYYLEY